MINWFCRKCWRRGDATSIEDAGAEHLWLVDMDQRAGRMPAGMDPQVQNSPMMIKMPGVWCEGDIQTVQPVKSKMR